MVEFIYEVLFALIFSLVIPGLVPGIYVDGRDTPGHDERSGG